MNPNLFDSRDIVESSRCLCISSLVGYHRRSIAFVLTFLSVRRSWTGMVMNRYSKASSVKELILWLLFPNIDWTSGEWDELCDLGGGKAQARCLNNPTGKIRAELPGDQDQAHVFELSHCFGWPKIVKNENKCTYFPCILWRFKCIYIEYKKSHHAS